MRSDTFSRAFPTFALAPYLLHSIETPSLNTGLKKCNKRIPIADTLNKVKKKCRSRRQYFQSCDYYICGLRDERQKLAKKNCPKWETQKTVPEPAELVGKYQSQRHYQSPEVQINIAQNLGNCGQERY